MSSSPTFSGSVPANYETYLGPLFFEPFAIELAQRLKEKSYKNILELACGTGRVTQHLLSKLEDGGTLTATDLNPDMLQIAKEKLSASQVDYAVADAQTLPFGDEQFDAAVCQFGVMFFADKPKAFSEVIRILQPGGQFFFNTWDQINHNALANITQQVLQDVFAIDTPNFFMRGPHSFFDPAEIKSLLSVAGFREIKIEAVHLTGYAGSVDDAVNGMTRGTPLSSYLAEQGELAETVRHRLRERLVRDYGETDLQLPMQAFVCEAIK